MLLERVVEVAESLNVTLYSIARRVKLDMPTIRTILPIPEVPSPRLRVVA